MIHSSGRIEARTNLKSDIFRAWGAGFAYVETSCFYDFLNACPFCLLEDNQSEFGENPILINQGYAVSDCSDRHQIKKPFQLADFFRYKFFPEGLA